jgi:hypothetical protein
MTPGEQADMRADGLSAERRANLDAGEAAAREWQRLNPWSLADYLVFLHSMQEVLGPFPVNCQPWVGDDFRL